MRDRQKVLFRHLVGIGVLAAFSANVHASGYRIEFQSASVMADSGEAAVVEDAGTNWYNSAGLVYIPQQLVFSAIDVYTASVFSGTATAPGIFATDFSATGHASTHPNNIIPAFHYSYPINDCLAVGVSTVPAWGLTEDFGGHSIVRYNLENISSRTLDIAPSIAWKVNTQWSVGVGPNIHYMSLQSTVSNNVLAGSTSKFSANSVNFGGHVGVLFRYDDATRVGLNYRSKIVQSLEGDSTYEGVGQPSAKTTNFKITLPLPPSTTFSVYHDFTPTLAFMGTVAYDQWSVATYYRGYNYAGTAVNPVILTQKMHNTFDFGVGTHYKYSDVLMLRANVKYEPTPTNNAYRDLSFPDGSKLGFQIGSRYQYSQKLAFDFLYGHVFTRSTPIHGLNPATGAQVNGNLKTTIDLVGAQMIYNI